MTNSTHQRRAPRMRSNIRQRGKKSWELKIELPRDPANPAKRNTYYKSFPTRAEAEEDRRKIGNQLAEGTYVAKDTRTVRQYIEPWLETPIDLNPKTVERYRQLAERQIYPQLGAIQLQKLRTSHVQDWHGKLLASGGKNGRPLSARTVRHAHAVLRAALARAVVGGLVTRNVASEVRPPKVAHREVETLTGEQIGELLAGIRDHRLYTPAVVALGTGLRRGELLALTWADVDLDGGTLQVRRSLGEAGKKSTPVQDRLYFKAPKSKAGVRSVSLAPFVVEALRAHRKQQLERRMQLGLGKQPDDALIFADDAGEPISPDKLSRDWANLVIARKLPRVSFHGLRHCNVSMLIDAGLDVYTVSRRIGHSSASLTLSVYTHLFRQKDAEAAAAIEKALTA